MEIPDEITLEDLLSKWLQDQNKTLTMDNLCQYAVGRRGLHDPMFSDIRPPILMGIYDDVEDTVNSKKIQCDVPGCVYEATSNANYEIHYNHKHRYTCAVCKRNLPSQHYLDLHLQETHDSYFAVMAEKKPSYSCLIDHCTIKFMTPSERTKHCEEVHSLPKNFRYDPSLKKPKNTKPKSTGPKNQAKDSKIAKQKSRINKKGIKDDEMMIDHGVSNVNTNDGGGNKVTINDDTRDLVKVTNKKISAIKDDEMEFRDNAMKDDKTRDLERYGMNTEEMVEDGDGSEIRTVLKNAVTTKDEDKIRDAAAVVEKAKEGASWTGFKNNRSKTFKSGKGKKGSTLEGMQSLKDSLPTL